MTPNSILKIWLYKKNYIKPKKEHTSHSVGDVAPVNKKLCKLPVNNNFFWHDYL